MALGYVQDLFEILYELKIDIAGFWFHAGHEQ